MEQSQGGQAVSIIDQIAFDQIADERDKAQQENKLLKQRIKRLEEWIESLEVLEQHSGILPEREWFGSEIGYLRKGEAVYKGEAKP
jgi:cell shape-determining protein MreC